MHPRLKDILNPAYNPCKGFRGKCKGLIKPWNPAAGHVPRGFYGALGDLSEVRLVMVLAEPGDPKGEEEHTGGIDSAYEFAGKCYRNERSMGHKNVMKILRDCFGNLEFTELMRQVWITESVLCSAPDSGARIKAGCERFCAERYLLDQLQLFPNATMAAMGKSKAVKRINRYKNHILNRIVECNAVYPPGCNRESTKPTWNRLVEIFTGA